MKNKRYLFIVLGMIVGANFLITNFCEGAPPQKQYYLTTDGYIGDEALNACAKGYHMASIFEILDVSNLKYNPSLGLNVNHHDLGFGPPSTIPGWARTGGHVEQDNNCIVWSSGSFFDTGTAFRLVLNPSDPWIVDSFPCDSEIRVWCVQD